MPSRADLHSLVNSLPEAALDAAWEMRTRFQVWLPARPTLPSGMERFKTEFKERSQEHARGLKRGTLSGFTMGGGYNPTQRSGAMSGSRWEADTLVVETHRHHLGHALTIVERLRLDEGRTLVYKHEVTGPGNISDSREIRFDVEAADSL